MAMILCVITEQAVASQESLRAVEDADKQVEEAAGMLGTVEEAWNEGAHVRPLALSEVPAQWRSKHAKWSGGDLPNGEEANHPTDDPTGEYRNEGEAKYSVKYCHVKSENHRLRGECLAYKRFCQLYRNYGMLGDAEKPCNKMKGARQVEAPCQKEDRSEAPGVVQDNDDHVRSWTEGAAL